MDITQKQESALLLIDNLIDDGIDVTNLRKELLKSSKYSYHAVMRHLQRCFGSLQNALIAYGLYEQVAEPSHLEIESCFYIDDEYKVSENKFISKEVKELYNISDTKFREYRKEVLENLEKEALDAYVRDTFPHGLRHEYIYGNKLWHIENYLRKYYGHSARKLCEEWGFSYELINESYTSFYITKGREFEFLVGEVLKVLHPRSVEEQKRIYDCIPDFIVDGTKWIDAKLSENTAFNRASKTFDKYLRHTDHLTIIYAKESEGSFAHPNVTLTHISEFIPNLLKNGNSELVSRLNSFLAELKSEEIKMKRGVDVA
ncbi:hypothetical protein [Bacillus subtilis]|uniref:hypothetical protein n=1 Tax=Bacillus subtilis TaxID=1423 RepID=UPI00100A1B06|nr:hypothetical protein [Bacillus subtilis]QAW54964.1 hypothetical protein ETL60_14705 [Bacillus subtilis]CAF1897762.1 hypothetical protein NRS6185_03825 [Bacillus subtilis]